MTVFFVVKLSAVYDPKLGEKYDKPKPAAFTAPSSLSASTDINSLDNTSSNGYSAIVRDNSINSMDTSNSGWRELFQGGEFRYDELVWKTSFNRFYMGFVLPSLQWYSSSILGRGIWF